jgi:hypothetical protein
VPPKQQENGKEMKMSKGNIVAALAGLVFVAATSASAEDSTSLAKSRYEECTTKMAAGRAKYGTQLTEDDRLFCACSIGGLVLKNELGLPAASEQIVERMNNACSDGLKAELRSQQK